MNSRQKQQLDKIKARIFDAVIQGVNTFNADIISVSANEKIAFFPAEIRASHIVSFPLLIETAYVLRNFPAWKKRWVGHLNDISAAEVVYILELAFHELFGSEKQEPAD